MRAPLAGRGMACAALALALAFFLPGTWAQLDGGSLDCSSYPPCTTDTSCQGGSLIQVTTCVTWTESKICSIANPLSCVSVCLGSNTKVTSKNVGSCGKTVCVSQGQKCEGLEIWDTQLCTEPDGSTYTQKNIVKSCAFPPTCSQTGQACSGNDLKKTQECKTPTCSAGKCGTKTTITDQTESCDAGTVCGAYSLYCKGSELWKKRDCTVNGCKNNACSTENVLEDQKVQDCPGGCQGQSCVAPLNQLPVPRIQASPNAGLAPLSVFVDGSQSTDADGSIVQHQWDFGDQAGAVGAQATHEYALPGNYSLQLTVTDNQGGKQTASSLVQVLGQNSQLAIQNLELTVQSQPQNTVEVLAKCAPPGTQETLQVQFYDNQSRMLPEKTLTGTCDSVLLSQVFANPGVYTVTARFQGQVDCSVCEKRAYFVIALPASPLTVPDLPPIAIIGILAGVWVILWMKKSK